METRANYVLIGACTLLAIVLGLGFFVWLAKFQVDRQYAYYDVIFDNVSGLSRAADVALQRPDRRPGAVARPRQRRAPGRVRVRIEVAADTPIHRGRDRPAPGPGRDRRLLRLDHPRPSRRAAAARHAAGGVPVIQGERSVVQSLTEDAPDLLQESIKLVREFQKIVGSENQAKVTGILGNIEAASGKLEQALADFSAISKTVSRGHRPDLALHRQARPDRRVGRQRPRRGREDAGRDDRRLQPGRHHARHRRRRAEDRRRRGPGRRRP